MCARDPRVVSFKCELFIDGLENAVYKALFIEPRAIISQTRSVLLFFLGGGGGLFENVLLINFQCDIQWFQSLNSYPNIRILCASYLISDCLTVCQNHQGFNIWHLNKREIAFRIESVVVMDTRWMTSSRCQMLNICPNVCHVTSQLYVFYSGWYIIFHFISLFVNNLSVYTHRG